jgi:hypothetical protein
MADENGGEFGGDGSVRWLIRSGDEINASSDSKTNFKVARRRGKSGTRCEGLDCQHGDDFFVTVKLPEKTTAEEFIKGIKRGKNTISFTLPIAYVSRQIQVHWGPQRRPRNGKTGS